MVKPQDAVTFTVPAEVLAYAENAEREMAEAVEALGREKGSDPEVLRAFARAARRLAECYEELRWHMGMDSPVMFGGLWHAERYYHEQVQLFDDHAADADESGTGAR